MLANIYGIIDGMNKITLACGHYDLLKRDHIAQLGDRHNCDVCPGLRKIIEIAPAIGPEPGGR